MGTSIRKIAGRVALAAMFASACATSHASAPSASETPAFEPTVGHASYYSDAFTGRRTASGEAYDPDEFTGAHRTLPFGTQVRVTDRTSGRSVVVRINDRGPWGKGRVIDVSRAAARELGLIRRGIGQVELTPALDQTDEATTD